jgi:outer membrane biosynthesis protein TonB
MKLPAKIVMGLLPFFLIACHKTQQAQVQPLAPPVEDNPPSPPSTAPVNLPPPVVTIPPEPTKNAPTPPTKPPAKHKKPKTKDNTPANTNTPAANTNGTTEEAANPAPNPGVSAIGQLSSGDPADYKKETEDMIASTEHGLAGITRTLNDTEQKTADQIREDLKEAKEALASGDVDGAHTLAEKAKVLLAELTQ